MCQKILKKQDELHDEIKHVQESLMSELNSVKNELKHAKSINDLIAKNADKNLETLLKIQKTQDQIMMKLLEGDAMEKMGGLVLKNIPDEPEKPEKPENENFSLNITVQLRREWTVYTTGKLYPLLVRESDTIRIIKLRFNTLARMLYVDTSSFRMLIDGLFLAGKL